MAATMLRLCLLQLAASALTISAHRSSVRSSESSTNLPLLVPTNSGVQVPLSQHPGHYFRANYLQDGCLIGVYTGVVGTFTNGGATNLRIVKSSDNGNSWTGDVLAYGNSTHDNDIYSPYILQTLSGRTLLATTNHYRPNFLNETLYRISLFSSAPYAGFSVHSVTSPDDGTTWGNRRLVFKPSTAKHRAGAPHLIKVGDTIVVSFMNSEHVPIHDDDCAVGYGATAVTILTSGDGGKSWGNQYDVFSSKANQAGIVALNETDQDSFLVMTSLRSQEALDVGRLYSQKVVLTEAA
ncbi:hypothetical protein LTR29_017130 [Friedmanniomyces endolithicus]|uniref:Sialidase domain-containing protein n=1 Tax=Friedmanniomyces endolithicus TaxID=329885 RepID=A0A4U0TPA9_9PEZI|nr:hypothetical protein LTR01_008535 [Friedmanniomyces endolithicus]KAK0929251.1 hypothetical protein LTR29_017130 [Friedmanniomyces endolithicus]TKA23893.1 hypothetical protein B0A54_17940 [Friedmanniomyces endolithicus]